MLRNDFNWLSDFDLATFRVAVYLASKPDDWEVRQGDVRKHCKGLSKYAYKRAIRELVDAGLLRRGGRDANGVRPPLMTTELFRRVRAGQTQGPGKVVN